MQIGNGREMPQKDGPEERSRHPSLVSTWWMVGRKAVSEASFLSKMRAQPCSKALLGLPVSPSIAKLIAAVERLEPEPNPPGMTE